MKYMIPSFSLADTWLISQRCKNIIIRQVLLWQLFYDTSLSSEGPVLGNIFTDNDVISEVAS